MTHPHFDISWDKRDDQQNFEKSNDVAFNFGTFQLEFAYFTKMLTGITKNLNEFWKYPSNTYYGRFSTFHFIIYKFVI